RADRRDATRAAEQLATDLAVEAAQLDRDEAALATLPTLRPDEAVAGLDAANSLAALATQREVAARRLDEAQARRAAALETGAAPTGHGTMVLAGAGTVLVVGLALAALGQLTVGGGLVAAALALGAIGLAVRAKEQTPASTADVDAVIELATDDVRRIDHDLIGPLRILRLDAVPSAGEAAGIRTHAERLATAAQQAEDQRARHATDRARHLDRTARLQDAAAKRTDAAQAQVLEAEHTWASWLERHDLPADLDPTGASEFLAAIERARGAAQTLAVTTADLDAQRSAADAFADAVRSLLAQLDDLGVPDGDPLTVLDRLATRAAGQRALILQIADAAAAVERAGLAERRAGRARAEAAELLGAELQTIGATSADDAHAILDRAAAAAELRAVIDDADARLDAATGASPERRSAATALLAAADPSGWKRQADELRRRLDAVAEDRDQCLHDQAVVRAEVEKLTISADVPTCELRVAGLEAELVEAVTAWASLTLAHQMVEGTLAKYQRERQPDVVKRAATLFTHITGGDYVRLEVRDNDVFAIDHAEREVPAHLLSQGAREQLYLCMRVALAESFTKTTSLPLLLDDITVNADARRQQQLSELLVTVADTQQVFAFTCHDSVVDQLLLRRPDAQVVTLQAHRSASTRSIRMGAVS
ncbi:MAG: hypothetical protein JWO77_333, partial [Ilumatobacteraceae bacterium]|nr:hypothetical protein [Ilumatobacteraceae bacterium]